MSGVQTLELNWGPSDNDREDWLAARRLGITATEVRDLYIGAVKQQELIDKKLGRKQDTFTGNAYTRWGVEREPIIAELIQERYAIAPESRLIRASDNPRFLYSPDGVGLDLAGDIVLSEIKTSGKPIPHGSEEYAKKGYLAQKAWGIRVTGAARILYAWEIRVGSPQHGFEVGDLHFEWVEASEVSALIVELERIATDFLVALDAAASEDFVEPDIDEELDTLAVNVLTARATESQGKAAKESAWKELQSRLDEVGVDFQQESLLARITYTAESTSETPRAEPDEDAARAADPVLANRLDQARAELALVQGHWDAHAKGFTRPVTVTTTKKAGLTVTAVKQQATKKGTTK